MRFFRRLIPVILFMGGPLLRAQGEAGVESPFVIGATAKDLGMGRAACAYPANSAAFLWNPAGMVVAQQKTLGVSHMTLFEGTQYQFVSYIHPTLSAGVFGLGVSRIGTGGIQHYEDVGGVPIHLGEMEYWWGKASIAYAAPLWNGFSIGFNFDANRQELGAFSTNGFGLDAGLHFSPPIDIGLFHDLHFGFQYMHVLQPQMKLGTETEKLPSGMRLGIARMFTLAGGSVWSVLYDYEKLSHRSAAQHLGMEFGWNNQAFLRAGLDNGELTFGCGLRYGGMQIDYGNGRLGESDVFARVHRFSLSFYFGPTLHERRIRIAESRQIEVQQRLSDRYEEERKKRINENMRLGKQYFDQEDYFNATLLLSRVLEDDPNHLEAKRMLDTARHEEEKRQHEREQAILLEGREREQQDQINTFVRSRFEAGRKAVERGDLHKAIQLWQEALEKDPDNTQLQEYLQRARIELANEINRLIARANTLVGRDDLPQARRVLEEAREKAGDNNQLRSKVRAELQRLDNTVNYVTNYQNGLKAAEKGDWEKAAQYFEEAMKWRPNDQRLMENYRSAKARSQGVEKKMPAEASKKYQQGINFYSQGKLQEALDMMNQALEMDPNNIKIIETIEVLQNKLKENQ